MNVYKAYVSAVPLYGLPYTIARLVILAHDEQEAVKLAHAETSSVSDVTVYLLCTTADNVKSQVVLTAWENEG